MASERRAWWESRWFLVTVVLLTTVPLLYPQIPPLVDLPGHIGRYRVELDLAHSPWLQQYYDYHWAAIGNLGVDLLIWPLGKLFGLEQAAKLIVLLIPPMTAAGFLWVAREVHGRIPPTAFFALPFIYGFPFQFGFVNFTLSVALAFLAFGLWLHLAGLDRTRLRGWLFVPISFVIYFCHTYGWALLLLMCFSTEVVRLRSCGRRWLQAGLGAGLHCSVMGLPLVFMLAWPGARDGGIASGWFDWGVKWINLTGTLRDRWGPFDVSSVELASVIFLFALVSPKLSLSRGLALAALLLGASFLILPRYVLSSAYADSRLLPYLFAVLLLSIRLREPADGRLPHYLALLGLAFFATRLAGTTASLAIAANDQQARIRALAYIPRGARVASFYGLPTAEPWSLPRDSHLGGLVIARREGFSNDQWITSIVLLGVKYREADGFALNPSQVVRPNGEHDATYRTIDEALAQVPRDKFDYIWLIDVPPFDRQLLSGLQPVWSGPGSTLYRIPH